MNQTAVTAHTAQLLLWIAERPRSYAETIEVWRPRALDWLYGKTPWLTTSFVSTRGACC